MAKEIERKSPLPRLPGIPPDMWAHISRMHPRDMHLERSMLRAMQRTTVGPLCCVPESHMADGQGKYHLVQKCDTVGFFPGIGDPTFPCLHSLPVFFCPLVLAMNRLEEAACELRDLYAMFSLRVHVKLVFHEILPSVILWLFNYSRRGNKATISGLIILLAESMWWLRVPFGSLEGGVRE